MDWDSYFLSIAKTIAVKSKDTSTKCGCVIVDSKHRIVSCGYNGTIQGINESLVDIQTRPMKYFYTIHAEMNAILFAHQDLSNCSLYCEFAPCENCLKHAIQAGISRFVYEKVYVHSVGQVCSMETKQTFQAIINMLKATNVEAYNFLSKKTYIEELESQ
jgi:dCMP deaminase